VNGLRGFVNQQTAIPPSVAADIAALEADVADILLDLAALNTEVDALPRGTMGYAQITASQTGITTIVDVTGLTTTFTAVTGRRYRVSVDVYVNGTVAADTLGISIANGSNTQLTSTQIVAVANPAIQQRAVCSGIVTGINGSTTYKIRAIRLTGSGNMEVFASSANPGFILVEDIGT